MNTGDYQNNIIDLPSITRERYENIFKIFNVKNESSDYLFYNILNKVNIPADIDESILGTIDLDVKIPWTILSHRLYGTQFLWWLIFLLNKPNNIFYADSGITYKYILPQNVEDVLNSIANQLR
jgi:hypothetical protein